LTHEGEIKHTEFFKRKVYVTMYEYLDTRDGKFETSILVNLLKNKAYLDKITPQDHDEYKKSVIRELFRKYDGDDSKTIDINKLTTLLNDSNLSMNKKETTFLMKKIAKDNTAVAINFEQFYECKSLI
jgi:hypothetical protein